MKQMGWPSLALASAMLMSAACGPEAAPPPATATAATAAPASTAPSDGSGVDVLLCDGKTKGSFAQGTPGSVIAGALMTEWLRQHPGSDWQGNERERHTLQPSADNSSLIGDVTPQGQTYGKVSARDVELWKVETEKLALAGSRVFHSGDELGSTVGVSCDMCHPHAANTHPETYPKFQAQLGRVVLLRDMINWCLQHPVRAEPMSADDPRMRALEGYIYAQRKGKPLDYGKH